MRSVGLALAIVGGGVACGGGGHHAGTVVVDDDPGALRRPSSARPPRDDAPATPTASTDPATPVALTATLTTLGPLTGTTQVPDELERLLPGDALTGKLVVVDGRGEPAFEVTRAGAPLLTVFYDERQRLTAAWIHTPSVDTVWGAPVGTPYAELAGRVPGLACSALSLSATNEAACSSAGLDNVVFVLAPVTVWRPSRGPADERAALGTDDGGEPGDLAARALELSPAQLAGARVTRIMWWPAD
jgi:hypothetical protein